jgi:hypothetical protein
MLKSNLVKFLRVEPKIDRWGKLGGNLTAPYDLIQGHIAPRGVLKLK